MARRSAVPSFRYRIFVGGTPPSARHPARFPAHTTPVPTTGVLRVRQSTEQESMARERKRSVALIVLDGWGYRPEREGNAIALAQTPTWDALWGRRSRTLLEASGLRVGLPEGQMGNSEVGHLNLGAGRVVMQDLVRISQSIKHRSFFDNPALVGAARRARDAGGTLHLMGLIGGGGVHAIDEHLFALLDLAERERVPRVAIHALLDGR